jgi:type IV pilus assembly protein PilN
MIRINLLPVRAAKKREFGRQQLILFAVLVLGAFVGNYLWLNKVDSELDDINRRIASTRAEIAQLEKTIGEVKSIKEEKKALEDKLKILDTLKQGRTGPVKVMDELATLIPQRVWILEYSESGGGVTMNGRAAAYEDLSTFSKKLKASQHFRDIVIRRASQRGDGIVDWTITCSAVYSA